MSRLTRGQAIRAYCIGCMCGQRVEVRRCPITDCPLYPFRMGKELPSCEDASKTEEEDRGDER